MDHDDGVRQGRSGAGCTVCGAPVPVDRIGVLAGTSPVDLDDLVRMRRFPAAWDGHLRSLIHDAGRTGRQGPA